MDFQLTDEQIAYRDTVSRFAAEQLRDDVTRLDAEASFSREAWLRCAAFGIQGLPVPPEYGGSGADAVTIARALEELGDGRRDNGPIFALHAPVWALQGPLGRCGTG